MKGSHYVNLYSVYKNPGDHLVVLDGTSKRCAEFMGVKLCTFYELYTRGNSKTWTIIKTATIPRKDVIEKEGDNIYVTIE